MSLILRDLADGKEIRVRNEKRYERILEEIEREWGEDAVEVTRGIGGYHIRKKVESGE